MTWWLALPFLVFAYLAVAVTLSLALTRTRLLGKDFCALAGLCWPVFGPMALLAFAVAGVFRLTTWLDRRLP